MARSRPKRAENRAASLPARETLPRRVLQLAPPAALLHLFAIVLIVLAMSPATRNLDNIKMTLYLALGPAILLAVLGSAFLQKAPVPPRSLLLPWGIYLVVAACSTIVSEYRWAGPDELLFLWASLGFCLGGFMQGSSRSASRVFLVGMTGLLFFVNLFGFFQFDLFGTGKTGVTLFQSLTGMDSLEPSSGDSGLQTLLHTFASRGSDSLMSTILNRDFYAAFCLLFMAFPLSLGMLSRRTALRAFSFLTAGMSFLSVLLCQSKGEYIALAVACLLFLGMGLAAGWRPSSRIRSMAGWSLGPLLLFATFAFVKSPVLFQQLKSLEDSFRSRLIIYRGALDIFREFPLLGGGPGTFKIYFPNFRSPDYYEWGISNVTNFSHNYFLDALSETGLFGLLALLGLLMPVALKSLRSITRSGDASIALPSAALLAGVVGFLVSNMTSVSVRWPIGAVGFWTVVGMLCGLAHRAGEDASAEEISLRSESASQPIAKTLADRGVRPPLIILFLAVSIPLLPFSIYSASRYWRSQTVFADGYLLSEQYRDFAIRALYQKQNLEADQRQLLVTKLNEAASSLKEATQIDPTLMTAYYHRGSTESLLSGLEPERKEGHLRASLEAFEQLSRLAPDYAELPYNLGIVHYQYALDIEQVLGMLPPESGEMRSDLEAELAEHQAAALDSFERMGRLSRRPEVLINLGESYGQVNRLDRALEVYRQGFELYPEDGRFAERLFRTGLELHDADAVIEAQVALWRLNPLNLEWVLGERGALAWLIAEDRRNEFARVSAEIEERIPVDPRLYAYRAMAAGRWHDEAELKTEIARYRRLGGRDPDVLTLRPAR